MEKDTLMKVSSSISSKDSFTLNKIAGSIHAKDFSLIIEKLDDDNLSFLIKLIDDKILSEVLEQSEDDTQQRVISFLSNYRIIYLFNYMKKDNIVDILGDLPVERRKAIINLMKSGERKVIQDLLGYEEDTAGGIMTTEYISVSSSLSAIDAISEIKNIAPRTEVIETIFVVDSKKELLGTVDLRKLFISSNDAILSDIMNKNYISVSPETDQEEVSLLFSKYGLKVLPVINNKKSSRNNYSR